jgi:hypothetical protein
VIGPEAAGIVAAIDAHPWEPHERAAFRAAVARAALTAYRERAGVPSDDRWLTVPDVARWARVTPAVIRAMCENGTFGPGGAFRLSNRTASEWRIRQSAVAAWMDAQLGAAQ